MHSLAQPQENLSGVTQKSRIPCYQGNEMPFPSSFFSGLFTPQLMERCFFQEPAAAPASPAGTAWGLLCLTKSSGRNR